MNNHEKKYELLKFEDGEFSLDVNVSPDEDTVWLTQKDMSLLFNVDVSRISRHIKNIFEELELDEKSNLRKMQIPFSDKLVSIYNLKVIIAVGHITKSKRVELFKKWATKTLNDLNNKSTSVEPIIKFQYDDICLDVTVSPNEDTVWLTQGQICELFASSKANISEHINHILEENELDFNSVVRNFRTTGSDGKTYNILHYNLDMIISVGYRVNSKRGIMFRKWATSVLKQYLLNGYAINADRIMAYQTNILQLEANVINIENRLKNLEMTIYSDNDKFIFEGEILEPYTFLRKLFYLAKDDITIIDPYADKFLLTMLSDLKVKITIVTSSDSYLNKEQIPDNITIIHNDIIHDRFFIIDDLVYAIGSSFNDIGKKRFFMMKLENITKEMILQERKKH